MVTGLEIKNLIQSHEYKRLLDKAEHDYKIKIYDNDDSISQECNSVAYEINKQMCIRDSNLAIEDILKNPRKFPDSKNISKILDLLFAHKKNIEIHNDNNSKNDHQIELASRSPHETSNPDVGHVRYTRTLGAGMQLDN